MASRTLALPYTILLPTDGSLPAIAATTRAMQLAQDRKARIIILGIREKGPVAGMEKTAEDSALMRTAGMDGVAYAGTLATNQRVPFEALYRNGAAVGEILRAAQEFKVDVIVVGSSKPKGLAGLHLGNVAEGVVKQAPCDVVVVKLTEDEMRLALQNAMELRDRTRAPQVNSGIGDLFITKKSKIVMGLFAAYGIAYATFAIIGSLSDAAFGAFAVAASANIPAIICALFWKRATDRGIVVGIATGVILSIFLIVISPASTTQGALFSLSNPGIVSIPIGFIATTGVSLADKKGQARNGGVNNKASAWEG